MSSKSGIAKVPVVLQNVQTTERLCVYTNYAGRYTFVNVPEGEYRIVEAYGEDAVPSTGDFGKAAPGPVPIAATPPISYAYDPPPGATHLDCVTPNTIYGTVGSKNVTVPDILNGPVAYIPIDAMLDDCADISPENLIRAADQGTFGRFPPGTDANTKINGQFVIQNIMNDSGSNRDEKWWRVADHTLGNEQGRMMAASGLNPGSVFFTDAVSVKPHSSYRFSAWILNLAKVSGLADPALSVEILGETGDLLCRRTLGQLIPVNKQCPEWKEIVESVDTRENTRLTVSFIHEGPAAKGNGCAIDDVALYAVVQPECEPSPNTDPCKCEAYCFTAGSCERTEIKPFEVSMPVTVIPLATPGKPDITCEGAVSIRPGHLCCQKYTGAQFTLSQKIDVCVPAAFGAEVCNGEVCICQ
jgi:hypothetical protein